MTTHCENRCDPPRAHQSGCNVTGRVLNDTVGSSSF